MPPCDAHLCRSTDTSQARLCPGTAILVHVPSAVTASPRPLPSLPAPTWPCAAAHTTPNTPLLPFASHCNLLPSGSALADHPERYFKCTKLDVSSLQLEQGGVRLEGCGMLHFGLKEMCSEMRFLAPTSEQFHIWPIPSCSTPQGCLQLIPPWFLDRQPS